jgi:mRNA interferase HigB
VRILSKRTLREFWESSPKYADAEDSLKSWYREAKRASWLTPADVKEQYRNASILKNNRTVFNIAGNKYRLVVEINYALQIIFIRFVGTHQDYDAVDVEKI